MTDFTRRALLERSAMVTLGAWLSSVKVDASNAQGGVRQSVCRWPYAKIPIREFLKAVADMGLTAVDLLTAAEWPIAKEFGITRRCSGPFARQGSPATWRTSSCRLETRSLPCARR